MRCIIVVPTIRESCCREFLKQWSDAFDSCKVIVVEDNPERQFDLAFPNINHYCWADIDKELGADSWIIPRRTDCIRSFGYLKAYQEQPDLIITLDDDCYPLASGFVEQHHCELNSPGEDAAWVSTIEGVAPRGMPYHNLRRNLECVINHGLWTNVPDLDAVTQLAQSRAAVSYTPLSMTVPRGRFLPMCGMNLAFKPKIVPALYFLLMGRDYPYDRFGDIWCGILVKKICDHLGWSIKSGPPHIEHQKASNVWRNLEKELPGYEINEQLWSHIDGITLTGRTPGQCYRELADNLPDEDDYWDELSRAMNLWVDLFE
jgi:reversibly glycosylated polypeptide/UDP-arabinopyranose mutase